MSIAPVLRATHVRRPADQAFALFTDRIGAWWPLPTHGLFGARSAGLAFEDGRLVERSVDGESTVWGEVLVWDPPQRLTVTWHPGHGDDGPASTVDVTFVPDPDGTRVELAHHGWQAFGADAMARRASYVGPSAWGLVLDHFADLGDRTAPDAELAALREGYGELFAEATAGGFGPPPAGEWTAEQVVAHIAVNDGLMAAVCRSLIHQAEAPRFENEVSNDPAVLDRMVEAGSGDLGRLVDLGRQRAEQLVLLLGRLDPEQRAAPVHARLVDHGQVRLDEPRPWWSLAVGVQTGFHLPSHTEQLRSLRPGPGTDGVGRRAAAGRV